MEFGVIQTQCACRTLRAVFDPVQVGGLRLSRILFAQAFTQEVYLLETQDYHPCWSDQPIYTDYSWLSDRRITEADVQGVDQ